MRRVVLLGLAFLGGCATGPDAGLPERLDAGRQRWARSGVDSYDMRVEAICFGACIGEAIVRVRGGARVAVVDPATGERLVDAERFDYPYGLVDALFDGVEQAIQIGSERIEVEFDRELGYPTRIVIDHDRMAVDDEITIRVHALDPIERPPVEGDLAENRARWASQGLADYDFVMSQFCFCPVELLRPVEVFVRAGVVIELVERASGEPLPEHLRAFYPTIDELFALLEEAIADGAEIVRVTFDPDRGYPREAFIDRSTMIADEEIRYLVSELAAAPVQ